MASDKVLAAVFNTIATILTWTSYGLGISSITSNRWIYVQSSNNSGLWRECYLNNCIIIATVDSWLHAARAFLIMMVVFNFLANLVNIVSQWKVDRKAREGSGGIWMLSAFFGVIGASIYSGFATQPYSSQTVVYGYGYIVAWVCTGLLFLANPCNYLSSRKMPDPELPA